MKRIFLFAILIFIGFSAMITSCTKDVFTEKDAFGEQQKLELTRDSLERNMELLRDSLRKVGGVINYSVGVVLASDAAWLGNSWDYGAKKSSSSLNQVIVTIGQFGRTITDTTDASGIASFKDLRIGTVNVNVRKPGYTEVDFVALLPAIPDSAIVSAYNIVRQVGTMVPVFSLIDNLSTISGIATIETDLTNDAPEIASNVDIIATIDEDNALFYKYINFPSNDLEFDNGVFSWDFDYYGLIKQIAFHSSVSKATTAADGSFSIDVPSTPEGLPIKVYASDFATNQSLLQATLNDVPVWGIQSIRTLFGPPITFSYSSIPQNGLGSSDVQSAYVQFAVPAGTPAAQPTIEAEASAVLSSSGIVSVNISNPGEAYTQTPKVKISIGSAFNSVQAEGTTVISGGRVTGVTITSPGSGYMPSDMPEVTFVDGVDKTAFAIPEFTFSIIDIGLNTSGSDYTQTPPNVTILGSGTGATAHAVMAAWVDNITVTSAGSGYTQPPHVVISDNFRAWDEGIPVMTTDNPLFSIAYDGTNTTLWPTSPVPSATVVGDGAGATATVTLSASGKVTGVSALVGGSGYTSAPTVTISGGGGFGATAFATIAAGVVDNIFIIDQGQGYTGVPLVTISGGAGSGASATAILGFPVQTVTLGNGGLGYNNVTAININNGGPDVNYVTDCIIKYSMGIRSIPISPNGWFYKGVPTVTITPLDGNRTGAAATATVQWEINDLEVDNPGSGYKWDNAASVTVRIDAPAGSGIQATGFVILGNGVLSRVELFEMGQGYSAPPIVSLKIDSEAPNSAIPVRQAKMTATVANGQLTGITIADPGAGYDFDSYNNNDYYIDISTYNTSAAATANANPKSGQIDFIQISNPGEGYAVVPTVEIVNNTASGSVQDANGFGKDAAATAVVTDGKISAINVTNPGSGYYETPEVRIVIPSTLMRAVGRALVSSDGRITGVDFPGFDPYTQGYGYNAVPAVTFFASVPGKGTGAAGVAVLNNGRVENVIMTNQGSGYIGKNNPGSTKTFSIIPASSYPGVIIAVGSKTYIRDIYFGTGKRTIED